MADGPPPRGPVAAGGEARFFVAGDGTLALENLHTGDRARLRYRRADGTYDSEAIARLARLLRSRDGAVGPVSLRLVELLAHVQGLAGASTLRVVSGYRSPAYNAGLRNRGRRAASASLHTEGMAVDVAVPRDRLVPLWHAIRALACCGAGLYEQQGFLHLDTGPARFWEAHTSRVDENLSAGNARVFARTEFDRYRTGEPIRVTLHAITAPPLRVALQARLLDSEGAVLLPVTVGGETTPEGPCIEVDATSTLVLAPTLPRAIARGMIALEVCEPRAERTPAEIRTNPVAIG